MMTKTNTSSSKENKIKENLFSVWRDSKKSQFCSFREHTNLFIYFLRYAEIFTYFPKVQTGKFGVTLGAWCGWIYLSVYSCSQVWTAALNIEEICRAFPRLMYHVENIFFILADFVSRVWLLSGDREEREEIKTMKGKYVRVTCIRCPRALPEGLSGLWLPLALNILNRGYF